MDGLDEPLDLLLADADDLRPVLDDGLPVEAAQRGPRPRKAVRGDDSHSWRRTDADPNDLPAQRWGVVAPEGREGDRLLEAITPLIRLREAEQRAPATIYRVPPHLDARQSVAWKDQVYWSEDVVEDERPLYLLLLGDLHQTTLDLQHSLANGALVGRAHFENADGDPDLAGYAAYAEKVARFARRGTPEAAPDLAFFVAQDGTRATITGHSRLVNPGLAASRRGLEAGRLPAASVRALEAETVNELLAQGSGPRPAVLLSVSHGLGAPRRGYRSPEEQWQRQGALVLGHDEILDAERVRSRPFLPGGMWFCVACFGAGTPEASAYHSWLAQLSRDNAFGGRVSSVLESLPAAGSRPFVAALPQAALSNAEGPLAIIGHLDLAWTYGFTSAHNLAESRKSRVLSALEAMVRGSRAGVALEALLRFYREANDALMTSYQIEADARAGGRPDPTDRVERGHLWMLRNDLRGYVLLGDPAARLPLRQHALDAEAPAASAPEVVGAGESARGDAGGGGAGGGGAGRDAAGQPSLAAREAAVHALIRGDEAPRAIAERAGASLAELWTWFDAYRAGGRARLGE